MLQLEQLKEKLRAEGLFAAERKRPLPRWPRRIGVVTSATGAAVHDIITVARRRCPSRILLSPALVQGDGAPASLTRALRRLWAMPEVDVIILGRGGGIHNFRYRDGARCDRDGNRSDARDPIVVRYREGNLVASWGCAARIRVDWALIRGTVSIAKRPRVDRRGDT